MSKEINIVGITGTNGAGKGTVVDRLVNKWGFTHHSARDVIVKEINIQGLPINRENMIIVGNQLREKFGPAVIAERLYEEAENQHGSNHVLESLRNPAEVNALRDRGDFILIAVDADPEKRFERIRERKSATDDETFESFMEKERLEMESLDPAAQNLRACIDMADYTIENNGSVDDLNQEVDKIAGIILKEVNSSTKI